MLIPFSKYVKITSGVGGGAAVAARSLAGLIVSSSAMLSPNAILQFNGSGSDLSSAVGEVFGTSSDEYKRTVMYASYISPSITAANRISFARYSPTGNALAVYGNTSAKSLTAIKTVVGGNLSLTVNGVAALITGINFSAATTLANVATILQTAIRTNAEPNLTTATVTYDAVSRRFVIVGGVVGPATINVASMGSGGITDVASFLGLYESAGAMMVDGSAAETPVAAMERIFGISNNFGSFLFSDALTVDNKIAVAASNGARNVEYVYCVPVIPTDAATLAPAVIGYAGTGVTLTPALTPAQYPEMVPMIIGAATNYLKRQGVPGFMYRQVGGLTPAVTSGGASDSYDNMRVNYYGLTQVNGQFLAFYQRGVLMGTATAPVDMNVFFNEMWLKSDAAANIMSAQLSLNRIPANTSGAATIRNCLQKTINAALFNGVISVGKTLTLPAQLFVTQTTGDDNAWQQVQNIGYWLEVVIQPVVTTDGRTEYKAVYTLIYSKDDTIRSVEGTHALV